MKFEARYAGSPWVQVQVDDAYQALSACAVYTDFQVGDRFMTVGEFANFAAGYFSPRVLV